MPLTTDVQGRLAILNSLVVDGRTLSSFLDNETVPAPLVELAEHAHANPAGHTILPAWRQLCDFVKSRKISDDPVFEDAVSAALLSALDPAAQNHEIREQLLKELGVASDLIS